MKKLFLLCVALIIGGAFWLNAEERTPEQIVEETSTEVLRIVNEEADRIKNDPGYVNSVIDELILPIVDLQAMGKLILGKHWKTASEEQRSRFISEFKSMLIRTYAKSIADYGHAKISVMAPKAKEQGKYHTVNTELDLGSGAPLAVAYVFRRSNDAWKVFDLSIDGLSLIKNFRTSFSQEISETSLDALIERLANTNAEKTDSVATAS